MKIPKFGAEQVDVAAAERRTNKRLNAAAFAALNDSTSRARGSLARAYRKRTSPLARVLQALSFARELSDADADRFVHEVELVAQAYLGHARRKIVADMRAGRRDVKSETLLAVVALSPPSVAGMNDQEHAAALIRRAQMALQFAAPPGLTTSHAMATAGMLHSAVVSTLPSYAPPDNFDPVACEESAANARAADMDPAALVPARCAVCATIAKNVALLKQNGRLDKFTAARAALRAFASSEKARDLVKTGRDFLEREASSRRE